MLDASADFRDRVCPSWSVSANCNNLFGVTADGKRVGALLSDHRGGGAAARSFADGFQPFRPDHVVLGQHGQCGEPGVEAAAALSLPPAVARFRRRRPLARRADRGGGADADRRAGDGAEIDQHRRHRAVERPRHRRRLSRRRLAGARCCAAPTSGRSSRPAAFRARTRNSAAASSTCRRRRATRSRPATCWCSSRPAAAASAIRSIASRSGSPMTSPMAGSAASAPARCTASRLTDDGTVDASRNGTQSARTHPRHRASSARPRHGSARINAGIRIARRAAKPWRVGENVELEPDGTLHCRRCGETLSGPRRPGRDCAAPAARRRPLDGAAPSAATARTSRSRRFPARPARR